MKIVMIPSVSGGVGHISRTATLAAAIRRISSSAEVSFVLDTERLRPFNIEAARQMGYEPRLMPPRTRTNRDTVARDFLGEADVIVDDTTRYLVPLRAAAPRAAWVSLPMYPLGDELFNDWPFLLQVDAVLWAYAPLVEQPSELGLVRDRLTVTGPFLDFGEVPERENAREALGQNAPTVLYAPRGFPFGREFGHRVLTAVFGAVARLRAGAVPTLRLDLLAVTDPADLRGIVGLPEPLPDWVTVHGLLPREEVLTRMRAAAVLVSEGTSTMHEAAALEVPQLLVPGPIGETLNLARALHSAGGGPLIEPDAIHTDLMVAAFENLLRDLGETAAMTARARTVVSAGGGVEAAARLVLELGAQVLARHSGSTS